MHRVHTAEDEMIYTEDSNGDEEVSSGRWCDFGGLLSKASLCVSDTVNRLCAGHSKAGRGEACSREVSLTESSSNVRSQHNRDDDIPYAYRINSLLVGKTGVGKSSLMSKFVENTFVGGPHTTTIGVEFASKIQNVRSGNGGEGKVKQHIWDTSGHESFASLTESYYTTAVVVYVVFSVADRSSFLSLANWIARTKKLTQKETIIVVVGNKIDAEHRSVSQKEGQNFAREHAVHYIETSAKSGVGVRELFQLGATVVWRGIYDEAIRIDPKTTKGIKALR